MHLKKRKSVLAPSITILLLIYKLKELGLTGSNILEIIKTMYTTFSTKIGLEQGDVLSILLLNLYK